MTTGAEHRLEGTEPANSLGSPTGPSPILTGPDVTESDSDSVVPGPDRSRRLCAARRPRGGDAASIRRLPRPPAPESPPRRGLRPPGHWVRRGRWAISLI